MDDYVKVATLENEVEAGLLDSILTERKIPHLMRSYHDMAFDGLFQAQKGWGHVSVPSMYKVEVLELIAGLRRM